MSGGIISDLEARLTQGSRGLVGLRGDEALNPDPQPYRGAAKPAAVLVPLMEAPGGLTVLLTRRSDDLQSHSGQVAFPGGRVDDTDPTLEATALREAREEVGLPAEYARTLGRLDQYRTGTGFEITPVVAHIHTRFKPIPQPTEVADIFEIPLAYIADRRNFMVREADWQGRRRRFYQLPFGSYSVWGATAAILINLIDVLHDEVVGIAD